ncbi:Gldg family protein [Marinifilum sp.]|uniref:Gldg family protein n=1 Tax=Marinifilum sp. TaxID=2033137 RepID=UPI003BAA6611
MKTTIRIAKLELNNLFYSPLAWLVLVGFSIYTAVSLMPFFEGQTLNQELYNEISILSLTHSIYFSPNKGYFRILINLLMVLVPLISMGVISREANTGSIKLLYSSPVKLRSVVLGKYIAVMGMVSLLMTIVLMAVLAGWLSIDAFDIGRILSSYLHLYLFAALIAAIAVYVSTFSEYPIVDAVATIALVYGLDLLYGLVKDIPVINQVMYWMAPSRQMSYAFAGLITSKSIMYFISLTLMFLSWAYFKMAIKRQTSKVKKYTRVKMGIGLLLTMGVIYVTSLPALLLYSDVSGRKVNEINPVSKDVLAPLKDKPIKITTYVNIFGNNASSLLPNRQISDKLFFHKYRLEYPQIEQEYVYFYMPEMKETYQKNRMVKGEKSLEELVQHFANLRKLDVKNIHHIDELGLSDVVKSKYANFNFRIIESEGKKSVLNHRFDDKMGSPFQAQISAAFKRVASKNYKAAFVYGHKERGINVNEELAKSRMNYYTKITYSENYDHLISNSDQRYAWINNGFDINSIKLDKEVPADIDVLFIAEPKSAFSETEMVNLKQYINTGGNLVITSGSGNEKLMNPIVKEFGVEYLPGVLVNDNPAYPADYNLAKTDGAFKERFGYDANVQMLNATALKLNKNSEFESTIVLKAKQKECWIDKTGPNSMGEIEYNESEGDLKADLPLAVQLERNVNGKTQKVFIASDADFLSNERLYNAPSGIFIANMGIMPYMSSWFTDNEFPLDIQYEETKDLRMKVAYSNIKWLKLLFYLIIPGIFALFGAIMLIKRMRN